MSIQLRPVLERFFSYYMNERNLEKTVSCVAENIISIGTGEHETAVGKEAFTRLYRQEFELAPDPLAFELRGYTEHVYNDNFGSVSCTVHITQFPQTPDELSFDGLLIADIVREGQQWLIASLHMSFPLERPFHWFIQMNYSADSSRQIISRTQYEIVRLLSKVLPGGVLGFYLTEGFPLYLINDELLGYLGYTYDEFRAATGGSSLDLLFAEDRVLVQQHLIKSLADKTECYLECRANRKDGTFIWISVRARKFISDDGTAAVICAIIDITNTIAFQEKLQQDISRDVLTPILNRKAAVAQIEESFKYCRTGTFFILDIDNFKKLNDTEGHQTGDEILQALAKLLLDAVCEQEIAARLGGDEFILYCPGLTDAEQARQKALSIQTAFAQTVCAQYPHIQLSISIGAAEREGDDSFNQLYTKADIALYEVKNTQKGSYKMNIDEKKYGQCQQDRA